MSLFTFLCFSPRKMKVLSERFRSSTLSPFPSYYHRFNIDLSVYPTLLDVEKRLEVIPAFEAAHPNAQPDAGEGEPPKPTGDATAGATAESAASAAAGAASATAAPTSVPPQNS
jgi:hypothetical protein